MPKVLALLLLGSLWLGAAPGANAQAPWYLIKELPPVPVFTGSSAASVAVTINQKGVVVGNSGDPGTDKQHATRWGPAPQDLSPDAFTAGAYGINDAGVVVGEWGPVAVKWASGEVIELFQPGRALAINAGGYIVGYGKGDGNRPYMFDTPPKPAVRLGKPDDYGIAYATVAAPGAPAVIVGYVNSKETSYYNRAAFLYAGDRQLLDNLSDGSSGEAYGVNTSYNVVGCATDNLSRKHAVIWYLGGGKPIELGSLLGKNSCAQAINNKNEVVGWAEPTPYQVFPDTHAFYWKPGQVMKDLNFELSSWDREQWTLVAALGINDKGEIVGRGNYGPEKKVRGFLMTPVSQRSLDALIELLLRLPDKPRGGE